MRKNIINIFGVLFLFLSEYFFDKILLNNSLLVLFILVLFGLFVIYIKSNSKANNLNIAFLLSLISYVSVYFFNGSLIAINKNSLISILNISESNINNIVAITSFTYAVTNLFVGYFISKKGNNSILVLNILTSLLIFTVGYTTNLSMLILLRTLTGISTAASTMGLVKVVSDNFKDNFNLILNLSFFIGLKITAIFTTFFSNKISNGMEFGPVFKYIGIIGLISSFVALFIQNIEKKDKFVKFFGLSLSTLLLIIFNFKFICNNVLNLIILIITLIFYGFTSNLILNCNNIQKNKQQNNNIENKQDISLLNIFLNFLTNKKTVLLALYGINIVFAYYIFAQTSILNTLDVYYNLPIGSCLKYISNGVSYAAILVPILVELIGNNNTIIVCSIFYTLGLSSLLLFYKSGIFIMIIVGSAVGIGYFGHVVLSNILVQDFDKVKSTAYSSILNACIMIFGCAGFQKFIGVYLDKSISSLEFINSGIYNGISIYSIPVIIKVITFIFISSIIALLSSIFLYSDKK